MTAAAFVPMLPDVRFHRTDGPEAEDVDTAREVLSEDEKERARRFHFDRDRHRWIIGRAWVRGQLGQALGLPAAEVPLAAEPGGRLYIPDAPFDFNLSHTGDWIALGLCRKGKIGIDLETVDAAFPAWEIAAEFFLPEEYAWISAGPVDRFFQLWTAKEALMKATGRGMSLAPDRIFVSIPDDAGPAVVTDLESGNSYPVLILPGPGRTVLSVVVLPG